MTWLLTAGKWVLGGVSALVGSFIKLIGFIGTYLAAWRRAKHEVVKDVAEVKDEQLEIAARPVYHRSTLLERMRLRRRNREGD